MLPNWNTNKGEGMLPPFYCVIDIETANPTPEDLAMEQRYIKTGNTKDPEKIRAKQEAMKAGLTDSAPIFCIGVKTPQMLAVFSWGRLNKEEEALLMSQGILGVSAVNEIDMLLAFGMFLNTLPENVRLITSNGEKFDLPHLRFRYARHDLCVPDQLDWHHTDLMVKFCKFSTRRFNGEAPFFSVEEMAEKLQIPFKKTIKGAQVPEFVRDGRHCEVILYNALDVLVEEQIARRLLKGKI